MSLSRRPRLMKETDEAVCTGSEASAQRSPCWSSVRSAETAVSLKSIALSVAALPVFHLRCKPNRAQY